MKLWYWLRIYWTIFYPIFAQKSFKAVKDIWLQTSLQAGPEKTIYVAGDYVLHDRCITII